MRGGVFLKIKLIDVASVIRSKNSGPFEITFDIIFKEQDIFCKFYEKKLINKELVSKLYNLYQDDVLDVIYYKPSKAIKVTIVRPIPSGNPGDTDVYGAQQHAPLLGLEFE